MKTSDFDYNLPQELIAQRPLTPRDASRLLVLDRETGRIDHQQFTDILGGQKQAIPEILFLPFIQTASGDFPLYLLPGLKRRFFDTLGVTKTGFGQRPIDEAVIHGPTPSRVQGNDLLLDRGRTEIADRRAWSFAPSAHPRA